MIIVIDDERTFATKFDPIYARSSNTGLAVISRAWTNYVVHYGAAIEELWLDHDLGGQDTIRPVVDYLHVMAKHTVGFSEFVQKIRVHSQNPTSGWIVDFLKTSGYQHVRKSKLPELV